MEVHGRGTVVVVDANSASDYAASSLDKSVGAARKVRAPRAKLQMRINRAESTERHDRETAEITETLVRMRGLEPPGLLRM